MSDDSDAGGMDWRFLNANDNYYITYGFQEWSDDRAISSILDVHIEVASWASITFDNYTIEYYISKERSLIKSEQKEPDEFDLKVEISFIDLPPDEFLGEANKPNDPNAQGSGSEAINRDEDSGSGSFTLDGVYSQPITYARIVLCDATGKALDYDASILKVTYNGTDAKNAGSRSTNGVYVYNDGATLDKEKINITLNAGIGNMNKYSIKCLLSTGTMEPGETKEPQWDYEYTYTFTYLFNGDIIQETLAETWLNSNGVYIDRNELMFKTLYKIDNVEWGHYQDFSNHWYAHWYVRDANDKEQEIALGSPQDGKWIVTIYQNGGTDQSSNWRVSGSYVWADNNLACNGEGWYPRDVIAKNTLISVPRGKLEDYSGYKIIFEVTNENPNGSQNGNPPNPLPDIKLRFVFEIPSAFTGKLKDPEGKAGETLTVDPRSANNKNFTVDDTNVKTHISQPKYARFFVVDAKDPTNPVDSDVKLSVAYDGNVEVQPCIKSIDGFYIFDNKNVIDLDKITVTLEASKKYKLYNVIGVFSTDLEGAKYDESDETILTREPDWDLQYTYNFTYNPQTIDIPQSVVWRKNGMKPTISIDDPVDDWDISWEELALEYYVKWYVLDSNNDRQELAAGNSRVADKWVISDYTVDETQKVAVRSGRGRFSFVSCTIYAPAEMELNDVKDCRFVCEIYANSDDTYNPNARYTFSLVKGFLGELKDNGRTGGKTVEVDTNSDLFKTLSLSDALKAWGSTEQAKYARVWLTTTDGTMVDPANLTVSMTPYGNIPNTDQVYGYYLSGENINLADIVARLNLDIYSYEQYQVHVALSTDALTEFEPDYDYVYTFTFRSPWKTKYKTAIYDQTSRETTIRLLSNWIEVLADCGVSAGEKANGLFDGGDFATKGYVRWYIEKEDGSVIDGIESLLTDSLTNPYKSLGNGNGYYCQGFDRHLFRDGEKTTWAGLYEKENNGKGYFDYQGYNPIITLKNEVNGIYENIRVVCLVTAKADDNYATNQWNGDPEIQVKYVFTLKTREDLNSAPFVHYVGESHRDYLTPSGASGAGVSWNYQTGKVETAQGNIRQNVHQTDYYVYIDSSKNNDNNNLLLTLPIEHWVVFDGDDKRTSTEPLAYFRWYDWYSDKKSDYIDKYDDAGRSKLEDKEYGLIAMMLDGASVTPYRQEAGVRFNSDGLNALKTLAEGEEITIACDVSRYMDGIVLEGLGKYYDEDNFRKGQAFDEKFLVHEPTLSMRYLFHIMPAKKIAEDIADAAGILNKMESGTELSDEERAKIFQLYEDNGHVVVPQEGQFALRVDLQGLNQYFIDKENPTQCSQLQWYSYYEDENGDLWKMEVAMEKDINYIRVVDSKIPKKIVERKENIDRSLLRLAKYEASDFYGTYTKIGASGTKDVTKDNCSQLHLVGYLGNGTKEQPVVYYGLEFTNEKPQKYGEEADYRTDDYMYNHLTHGGTLDFDELFSEDLAIRYAEPKTSHENYADAPLAFENAQYGYSYPQLYGQCASTWQIYHGAWWDGYGIAPTHSDYTLLKSMNVSGISASQTYENQSIYTYWYDDQDHEGGVEDHHQLYDVTHVRNNSKYGTFLYVDAADEARTIAHLEFEATLCSNSEFFYTAYVANMGKYYETPPQVMFRVSTDIDDGNGGKKRIPVVSFLTGDIQSQGVNESGAWYQVYGSTKIPKELVDIIDGTPRTYYVAIDNYSENTDGADYAIDHISFFTTTAKVQILQSSTPCDESSGIEVSILAKATDLIGYVSEGQVLYYRIFKRNSENVLKVDDAVVGEDIYQGEDGYHYGSVTFFENTTAVEDAKSSLGPGETGYYYSGGQWYFQFDRREFKLETDSTYFVSFYSVVGTPPPTDKENETLRGWGNPYSDGACETVYSNDITPRVLQIDFKEPDDTDYDGTIRIPCDVQEVEKTFTITVQYPMPDGGYSPNTVSFDYYMGEKSEFKGIYVELVEGGERLYLEKALERFRANYPTEEYTAGTLPEPDPNTEYDEGRAYTKDMYNLIKANMDKLRLLATSEFNYKFTTTGTYKFAAIPVVRETADGYICSPLEFVFEVEKAAGGPQLTLGFKDVDYKEHGNTRVVRVGLEQLNNVKTNGTHTLHIPVHSFEYKNKDEADNSIVFDSENLVLWSTTDPANKVPEGEEKPVVATLLNDANADRPMVNNDHQYLAVKFKDDFTFHEGYQYELHTVYYDLEDDNDNKPSEEACATNDLTFIIKVVPKYVTWKGGSTQWNDDSNWSRSTRGELYKDDYDNTQGMGSAQTTHPAFVPMKFTYVTMPEVSTSSSINAPMLVNLTTVPEAESNKKDEGIYTNIGPTKTDNIEYDLMVRYTEDYCVTDGHEGYNNTNEKIYDCEKFYGNWAKEIYFKPRAELVHQHYLTYEKVWVEKLLTANTWTLMSTPLQNTYAGDMYVPKDGRQETEAFKDITFGTDYSRTLYPIYQRSWAQAGSTVHTATSDMYSSDYSANLVGSVKETFTLWSHTYNDVTVDYSKWKGFAIRAHKKPQTEKALLRLPKSDESFNYYDWNDNSQATDQTTTLDRGNKYGKLFTDDAAPDGRGLTYGVVYDYGTTEGKKGRTAEDDGIVKELVNDIQSAQGYQLVGNPYLCSIDMGKFLFVNEDKLDESGYWTYENNFVSAYIQGQIRPMQSFFVKAKSDAELVFNEGMMIDGNTNPIPSSVPALTMTAGNERGQSSATLSIGEEARSVETLFDSNLEDVPMVYTVADGQAVSINQLTELRQPIAFGVTCMASDELVEVTFTDVEQLTTDEVRVVDAVTGSQTTISEGSTLTVQPNDYGRYFLLAGTTSIGDKMDVQKGIMVSVRGKEVTVTSGEELTQVRALTLNGALTYQHTAGGNEASFTLSSGVYIIQAENKAGEQQTVKVVVR